jgi:hypothetical protein
VTDSSDEKAAMVESEQKRRLYAGAFLYALAVGTLVMVLGIGAGLLVAVDKLTDIAETNKANGTLLVECTTSPDERHPPVLQPKEDDCYLRSRNETGTVVTQINKVSIVAAACGSAHPGDVAATQRCVEEGLKTAAVPPN